MAKLRIKELREEKGLSQRQVAEAIGLNYRTIGHYENDRSEPNLEIIEKLCNYFEIGRLSLMDRRLIFISRLK